jgi:heavy metal sensor kinase
MPRKRDLRQISRGLRFRLTASYALFFTLLLIGVALLFREQLDSTLQTQEREALNDQWAAMKGYLRIEKKHEIDPDERAIWYYDAEDPDETRIVLNIKSIYLIADAAGKVILDEDDQPAVSPGYKENVGIDSPAHIQAHVNEVLACKCAETWWGITWNADGERFLTRSGIVWDQKHQTRGAAGLPYYVALGTPLSQYGKILRGFTWIFILVIPGSLILGTALGWFMAGRALTPVRDVAEAAQRISGSNLSLRIPTRQAGDELDYLILTFNRMIERLEASFQQMKQFSTDVSHELRTPITGIRGQLEVALFTAQTTEQYREAMFNALQDIDRLSQIVRALLLLSQAESGQLVLQKSRLNLCEVVSDLVDQFQIPAEEAGVRLRAQLPPECPADVDRVQIERMITNLLSNAIKFTPRGGEVRMSIETWPERIEILVEDTGPGIATEHLPHIFDRFYRVPGSGTAPTPEQGLGLGLSFVAWIAKAHGATIDVHSTPGQGTRFTISLPAPGSLSDTMEMSGQPAARV